MAESSQNRQKTLWKKEKLFTTSNFSFSHSFFIRLVRQTCTNQGLYGKGLTNDKTLDQSKLEPSAGDKINMSQNRNFELGRIENIVMKGENAVFKKENILRSNCPSGPSRHVKKQQAGA